MLVDSEDVPLKLLKRMRERSGTARLIEEQLGLSNPRQNSSSRVWHAVCLFVKAVVGMTHLESTHKVHLTIPWFHALSLLPRELVRCLGGHMMQELQLQAQTTVLRDRFKFNRKSTGMACNRKCGEWVECIWKEWLKILYLYCMCICIYIYIYSKILKESHWDHHPFNGEVIIIISNIICM